MRNPHLTDAQYRMLRRAARGERLPVERFKHTMATVASITRKGLWVEHKSHWHVTSRGREVYAQHGKDPSTARAWEA